MWRPSNKYLYGRTSTYGTPLNEASEKMREKTALPEAWEPFAKPPEDQGVRIGDRFRFSVALLKQIYEEPAHISVLVELSEVRSDPDGAKVLVLKRVYATGA